MSSHLLHNYKGVNLYGIRAKPRFVASSAERIPYGGVLIRPLGDDRHRTVSQLPYIANHPKIFHGPQNVDRHNKIQNFLERQSLVKYGGRRHGLLPRYTKSNVKLAQIWGRRHVNRGH